MSRRTYIRAPNLDLVLGGPIRLGHVIENPYRPTKPLYTLDPLPATITVPHLAYEINRSSAHTLNTKSLANLFQACSVNVCGDTSKDIKTIYEMERLETIYFKADPTDEEAEELAKINKIMQVLNKWPRRPVYMITGLKIAKGLKYSSMNRSQQDANASGKAQVTDQVSVGGEVGGSHQTDSSEMFSADHDVIIAYRLHVIAKKGWWQVRAEVKTHQPKFGFMSKDNAAEEESEKEPVEAKAASTENLISAADFFEVDYGELEEAQIDDERFVVIPF